MNKPIIEIKNIWKKYAYGQKLPYFTLRDSINNFLKKPFSSWFKGKDRYSGGIAKNEFWALKEISLSVGKGEIIGIIGRNGAGKSTLLKILSRITPPDRGEVRLWGRVNSLLEVGTGFQGELTGRENIFLNGAILGMQQSEIKAKFNEILEFSEIGKFIDTPVKYYSSGMYVRLAFSVAAHLQPEILIIDEVLAVGDASFQKKCLGKIENVAQSGRTILFVSHNIGAIRNLCNRAVLIDNGQIVSAGSTDIVLQNYNKLLRNTKIDDKTLINNQKVRRGSGAIRFMNIEIMDSTDQKRYEFKTGESVRFKLSYKVFNEVKGLTVSVALRSGITREMVTSVKHNLSGELQKPGTMGTAIIEIPKIFLRPGDYPLYLFIGEIHGKKTNYDVLDDMTAPLTIVNKDETEESVSQTQFNGYFSIPSRLIINKIN